MIPLHPECRCIALPYIDELQKYYSKPKEEEDWLGLREGINTRKSQIPELYKILTDTIMIRRLKKDVLKDLPRKINSFIPIELDNLKEYKEAEKELIHFLKRASGLKLETKSNNFLTSPSLEEIMLLVAEGKLKQSLEWIRNFLELGNKLILYASHKFVKDSLEQTFQKVCIKLDGSVTVFDRQKVVDDFQTNPKVRILIADLPPSDDVIKLTTLSNIAFLDIPSPMGQFLKSDSLYSIGQKDIANIYYLFGADTIEERLAKKIECRRGLVDSMTERPENLFHTIDEWLKNESDI